jgi:hypothetical protein
VTSLTSICKSLSRFLFLFVRDHLILMPVNSHEVENRKYPLCEGFLCKVYAFGRNVISETPASFLDYFFKVMSREQSKYRYPYY